MVDYLCPQLMEQTHIFCYSNLHRFDAPYLHVLCVNVLLVLDAFILLLQAISVMIILCSSQFQEATVAIVLILVALYNFPKVLVSKAVSQW